MIDNFQETYQTCILLQSLLANPNVQQFKYYNEFNNKWKIELNKNAEDNKQRFLTSSTVGIFDYSFFTDQDIKVKLRFNATAAQMHFARLPPNQRDQFFIPTVFSNEAKKLICNGSECQYVFYPTEKIIENNSKMDMIFASVLPILPPLCVVFDGNHRVSALINQNASPIMIRLVSPQLVPKILCSSFEECCYCFLMDYCSVLLGKKNNINDIDIKRNLYIFK